MDRDKKVFIIAEAGVNHNGSMDLALKLVSEAAKAGADAVKFQTFTASDLVTPEVEQCAYQAINTAATSQMAMLKDLELSKDQFADLADACQDHGIQFMSTGFDADSLDFLICDTGIQRIKIPSGELTNPLLLLRAARSGLPIILSTGMADLNDIDWALGTILFGRENPEGFPRGGCPIDEKRLADLRDCVSLLQCTTAYPTPYDSVHLRVMATLSARYGLPVGLSDHTMGTAIPVAATALGAVIIEKHFTLDCSMEGPDHKASLRPDELSTMITEIRQVEVALGNADKSVQSVEKDIISLARRSIVACKPIMEGEALSLKNTTIKRAGTGLSAHRLWEVLGKKAEKDFAENEVITCMSLQ